MPLIEKSYKKDTLTMSWSVGPEYDGLRFDQFLGKHFRTLSREEIKKKIQQRECQILNRLDSKKPASKIKNGDVIKVIISRSKSEDEYWRGEKIKFSSPEEVYEDEEIIIINKPPYMSTHPTGRHLFHCATVHYEQKLSVKTVHSIHRLDRETSGLLVLSKNPTIASTLTNEFENSNVQKAYFWIAKKKAPIKNNVFSAFERMDNPQRGLKKVFVNHYPKESNRGKYAHTDFVIVAEEKDFCVGLAFPKTGRTHQIRVHAMANLIPLVGDKLYSGGYPMFQRFKDAVATTEDYDSMILSRHALHAVSLQIKYKDRQLTFFAPLPDDLKKFIEDHFNRKVDDIERAAKEVINQKFKMQS